MKLFGQVKLTVNGKTFASKNGASLDPGGIRRTPVDDIDNRAGDFTESTAGAVIECEIPVDSATSLDEIGSFVGATVSFACDSGQRYVIAGAYSAGRPSISSGSAKVTLYGPPAQEMK